MTIAIIADVLDTQSTGIYTYLRQLLNTLYINDQVNSYILIRPNASLEYPKWKQITVPISKHIPFHLRIRQLQSIPKILSKLNVDVVFEPAHFGPFNLPKHIYRITMIHDLTPILFPKHHDYVSYLVHKLLLRRILKKSDRIIVNSKNTKKDVIQYESSTADKIKIIYPGSSKIFKPTYNKSILRDYKIDSDYILYVGTLEPRKNLEMLVSSFEKLHESNPSLKLVLVGKKGWKIESLLKRIERSQAQSNIIMTGYVQAEHLPTLYSLAKVFVYPSIYEGFGIPLLEAMNCGTPIITSSNSSLEEVTGDCARYINNEKELLQNLNEIISDKNLQQKMSQESLRRAKEFSWDNAHLSFTQLINSLDT